MLNVGLTGNVASGKSTVARHFAAWGATVLDADALVREVQRPGLPVAQAIEDRFGSGALRPDGTIQRARLRALILQDPHARRDLNAIVHPAVQALRVQRMAEARERGDLIVVNDIPLLFEALDPRAFDLIVLVDAPADVRYERLTRARGLSPPDAERLMAAQLPSTAKRRQSDAVIDNVGTMEALEARARSVWLDLRRQAAARATVPGASLLTVLPHPEDAAVLFPGTLRRYADAGVHVHVVCARADAWPATLPVDSVTEIDVSHAGAPLPGSAAVTRIAERLAATAPHAVITFGPDGLNGHPDHIAAHHWTRQVMRGWHAALYYVTEPPTTRDAPGHARAYAVALDVRPWLSGASSGTMPCGLIAVSNADRGAWNGREWFAADVRFEGARWDLLRRENAG